jgi:hypothetical protein
MGAELELPGRSDYAEKIAAALFSGGSSGGRDAVVAHSIEKGRGATST